MLSDTIKNMKKLPNHWLRRFISDPTQETSFLGESLYFFQNSRVPCGMTAPGGKKPPPPVENLKLPSTLQNGATICQILVSTAARLEADVN